MMAALAAVALVAGCNGAPAERAAGPTRDRIGLLLDSLVQERWQRDRDLFVERVSEFGKEVLVRSADGDHDRQVQQAEELLEAGVKVLVVVPHDTRKAAAIVEAAKQRNVPVISYDRLIKDADVDLYVSFDNVKVGEMQAQYLFNRSPKGNYLLIGGAPIDHNAELVREGQMKVLGPAVERGQIRIVGDPWTEDWSPAEAREHTEAALKRTRNNLAAVVASNDGTARGVVEALEQQNVAGKVLVSGQDADLTALRRIVAGTQSMTVYKPLRPLAHMAARAAVDLAEGDPIDAPTTIDNGFKEVPARLLDPITVDKGNLDVTVIRDGFHKREEIFKEAPVTE
jgi:D-xylose transport system substrate-binding protein